MIYSSLEKQINDQSEHNQFKKIALPFSLEKGEKKILKLTDSEQSAFLSYYTIKFIIDYQNVSNAYGKSSQDARSIR